MSEHRDDSQISRFERQGAMSFSARDAVLAVLLAAVLCVLLSGGSVGDAAAEIDPGIGREVVEAVGEPTEWIAERFPFAAAQAELTAGLSPEAELGEGGFEAAGAAAGGAGPGPAGEVPPVTADAFDPAEVGAPPPPKAELETLLVTGDSLSTPLDQELARRLTPDGVEVIRDPHLATGISNSDIVDWGELSSAQVREHEPDATVVFIGANEGYAIPGADGAEVECCGAEYAAAYANRVRQVMDTFRRDGEAKVYWLTVMAPRDPDAQRIAKLVNAAIRVAAQPWGAQVRVVDTLPTFTPEGRYRDSIAIDGEDTIVRESDGIHLNDTGSALAADLVLERIDADFTR